MGFWNKVGNYAKRAVGASYNVFKRTVGFGRTVLNSVYNLKEIPGVAELAASIAEGNPELGLVVGGVIGSAEVGVKAGELAVDLIDDAISTFSNSG